MVVDKFWMVWGEEHGLPTFKHPTEQSARAEAERLARLYPRSRFDVLELIASCVKNDVSWVEAGKPDDPPF